MERASKKVVGKYRSATDVKAALQRLERDGFKREDITLYTNNTNLSEFETNYDLDMLTDKTVEVHDDNDSLWTRLKDMVSYNHNDDTLTETEHDLIDPYKEDIDAGYTIITVREDMYERLQTQNEPPTTTQEENHDFVLVDEEPVDFIQDPGEMAADSGGEEVSTDLRVVQSDLAVVEEHSTDLTVVEKDKETIDSTQEDSVVSEENEELDILFKDPIDSETDLKYEDK